MTNFMAHELPTTSRCIIAAVLKLVFAPLIFLIDIAANTYYWYFQESFISTRGKAVLITGCDSGFGKDAAQMFAARGAYVFASCLTQKGADELANQSKIETFLLDITKEDSMNMALETVKRGCERENLSFWGLVSNAGISLAPGPADWFSFADIQKVVDINMMGHIRTILGVLPMIKRSKGRVVVMSSFAGHCPNANMSSYCASKFGILGFAECLRADMKRAGVSVSTVAPEFYPTNIIHQNGQAKRLYESLTDEQRAERPDYLQKSEKMNQEVAQMASGNKVIEVAEAYYNAIFGVHPRQTYFMGKQAGLLLFFKSLPDYLSAFLWSLLLKD